MIRNIRKAIAAIALALVALSPSAALDGSGWREVVYYGDQRVRLPETVTRIATNWEAHNSILTMLGYGDRIVATTRIARAMPLFQKFVPSIKEAALTAAEGGAINVEELLVLKPDVLFVSNPLPDAAATPLRNAGIALVAFRNNSIEALVERTLITGEMLGPDALAIARDYAAYFEASKARVAQRLDDIPAEKRLKVFLASGTQLSTSGRPSLNQDWMDLGGAVNIAEGWFSGQPYTSGAASIEDIIAAAPDVVIAMRAADAEEIRNDPRWRNVKAVREGRVYANPRGLFWWSRETTEQALQFLWLAKTLYPRTFPDMDLRKETGDFYRRFYRIELTEEELDEFLEPTF